jgi:hypothetical protein
MGCTCSRGERVNTISGCGDIMRTVKHLKS